MSHDYTIHHVDRGECLEYRDEHDVYRFGVTCRNRTWVVLLPATKGRYYEPHPLTDDERHVILPRIKHYLEQKKSFVICGSTYPVVFEMEEPASADMAERRRRVADYFRKRDQSPTRR